MNSEYQPAQKEEKPPPVNPKTTHKRNSWSFKHLKKGTENIKEVLVSLPGNKTIQRTK